MPDPIISTVVNPPITDAVTSTRSMSTNADVISAYAAELGRAEAANESMDPDLGALDDAIVQLVHVRGRIASKARGA